MRIGRGLAAVAICVGCTPEPDPRAVFERDVLPVFEASCGSTVCHGVALDAEARGEVIDWDQYHVRVDPHGRVLSIDEAYRASLAVVNTLEAAATSSLLRKPLAVAAGGLPHYGGEDFSTTSDPRFEAIEAWIDLETEGGEDPEILSDREQQFADDVQRNLIAMTCANANCHGPGAATPFALDPGVDYQVPAASTRANYETVLKLINLDGDPLRSRLLVKALPLHDGGVLHRGGNDAFLLGEEDERLQPIVDWVCAERKDRTGLPCPEPDAPPIEGFVYVEGPVAPAHAFDVQTFVPGTDLVLAKVDGASLVPHTRINLTAHLHDAPADVRDPAVSPDGTELLFSMRTSEESGHDLYRLHLETLDVERLTSDAGPLPQGGLLTYRDPTWGPEGSIWFVSTAAGRVADGGQLLDTDVYELVQETGEIRRRTWTPHIERKLVYFTSGHPEMAFSSLRQTLAEEARAHPFRFPVGLATEYHQHFGITPPETLFWDMRELADGRYVTVVGELDHVWEAGVLGVVDRNFGPELVSSDEDDASIPGYADPLTRLSAPGDGLYADPVGLPDGRLLVALDTASTDPSDPLASPDFGIYALTLEESVDGSGPTIVSADPLVDQPGIVERDAEPVFLRHMPPPEESTWDPDAATGLLVHQGMPMIDAILGNLEPVGTKIPRDDIVAVRIVESIPVPPNAWSPVEPTDTRDGHVGATTVSLGHHGPQRILAELDLAADGTFQAEIPTGTAFRLQNLNADGMAVGTMHNRWLGMNGGQRIPQGVQSAHYDTLCAVCHGAQSGAPSETFGEPDLLTTASFTLARYEQQNPRLPIAPPVLGDDTAVEIDFTRDVQPILTAACASSGCHAGSDPAAGLSLTDTPTTWFTDAYESLLADGDLSDHGKEWVDEPAGRARSSFLIEVLTGRELEAPGLLAEPNTPHGDLSADEIATIVRWIELGATFVGTEEGAW